MVGDIYFRVIYKEVMYWSLGNELYVWNKIVYEEKYYYERMRGGIVRSRTWLEMVKKNWYF